MQQNATLASEALKVARAKIGVKEATGRNDGKFVSMLQRWLANGAKWMDGQPWCATFATWCIAQAASKLGMKPLMPKNGSSTSIYSWAKKNGALLKTPIAGCIGLMRGDPGHEGKTHHHTFLVDSVDAPNLIVHGIDGNWKNAVTKTAHRIAECDFVMVV